MKIDVARVTELNVRQQAAYFSALCVLSRRAREGEPYLRWGLAESKHLRPSGNRAITWASRQLVRSLMAQSRYADAHAVLIDNDPAYRNRFLQTTPEIWKAELLRYTPLSERA